MKRVAVLRGGPSSEYAVSLKSGHEVLQALRSRAYSAIDVVITRQGEWLIDGYVRKPEAIMDSVDMLFLALHGEYGEDGTVQRLITRHQIPYLGSAAIPSATAFNKALTKQLLQEHDIKMPRHVLFTKHDLVNLQKQLGETRDYLGTKLVLKPARGGSSIGVTITDSLARQTTQLVRSLKRDISIVVEEWIGGTEATCGILGKFRDQENYILPVIEIVPPATRQFFDAEAKYDGSTEEICPGRFSYGEKQRIAEVAEKVHSILGLTQLSRSDFIVKDNDVYFLEVNTLPGLTAESLYPKATKAVGLEYPELIEHLINTADR